MAYRSTAFSENLPLGDDTTEATLPERYDDQGLLGVGGMSVVRRVWDRELERSAALKFPRPGLSEVALRRFAREARLTASLQHPGVIPIYDRGTLPDGRPFFTMAEVHGQTLDRALAASPLRRRMEVFARVCATVAFAHSRGIVHGDLKPGNVMIGAFGEVLVLDWGIAREAREETHHDLFSGTPSYMAPEQARGAPAAPVSDVYSLGAVLFELLVGEPPFGDTPDAEILTRLCADDVPECTANAEIPSVLVELVNTAMSPWPQERGSAAAFDAQVRAWLDQDRRREQAMIAVQAADQKLAEAARAREEAARREQRAIEVLAGIPAWAEEAQKQAGWALQDEARACTNTAALATVEAMQQLREALSHDPSCRDAHQRLADYYRAEQARAEAQRDPAEAERLSVLVRAHGGRRHARWLEGTGALSLQTDPPGAQVRCFTYQRQGRRLVAQPLRELGTTPLNAVPLPMGSHLLLIRHPDCDEVRYPVHIGRTEHWDGVPPGETSIFPIRLPRLGELPTSACYVPAGWARVGGDDQAMFGLPAARTWVPGFVIDADPISNRALLALVNRLEAEGRGAEVRVPRARTAQAGVAGAEHYARDAEGRWQLVPDADGDLWDLDWPVFSVDWWDAEAVARWRASLDGRPWRLLAGIEREKATRGVDGRFFPWGDHFDPSFCCMRDSHPGRPLPQPITRRWADESVYGARGLVGNIRDWCADVWGASAQAELSPMDPRLIRGGSWVSPPGAVRAASRQNARPTERSEAIGMRHGFGFE